MMVAASDGTALIIGSGSGIGAAVARKLAGGFAGLVLADQDVGAAERIAARLKTNGARVEGPLGRVADVRAAERQAVIDVNLSGTWHCLQHEIRAMLVARGGAVVNVASIYGLRGAQGGCVRAQAIAVDDGLTAR